MATRRNFPYVWPTWLTPLLAGDAQCWFAPWVKSNFKIEKVERGGFDLAEWKVQHAEMVTERVRELKLLGGTVTVEDQNEIKLRGRSALLAGKPDIVAICGNDARVEDCKSGQRKNADLQQILIYMYALPLVRKDLQGKRLVGAVIYRKGEPVIIHPEQFTDVMRQRIKDALVRMGNAEPPEQVPSAKECAWCDVSLADCPKRMATEQQAEVVTAEF